MVGETDELRHFEIHEFGGAVGADFFLAGSSTIFLS
jgi:hypothetical protein